MTEAGFHRSVRDAQPGSWISPDGVPVDLMLPDSMAGEGGRRGARIPPHSKHAARRAVGLEAAVVDNRSMSVRSLDPEDDREYEARVATPAALIVAKLHKLGERQGMRDRLLDKDAHDLYRLLVAIPTQELAEGLARLKADPLAGDVTADALELLRELFAGTDASGSLMAGRTEEGVGDPDVVAASVAALAGDVVTEMRGGQD